MMVIVMVIMIKMVTGERSLEETRVERGRSQIVKGLLSKGLNLIL